MITSTAEALAALGVGAADARSSAGRWTRTASSSSPTCSRPSEVAEMRAEWDRLRGIEGEFGGHEVHIEPGAPRLSNLFNKSAGLRPLPRLRADPGRGRTISWARSGSTR